MITTNYNHSCSVSTPLQFVYHPEYATDFTPLAMCFDWREKQNHFPLLPPSFPITLTADYVILPTANRTVSFAIELHCIPLPKSGNR
jgi:hypothetical protein